MHLVRGHIQLYNPVFCSEFIELFLFQYVSQKRLVLLLIFVFLLTFCLPLYTPLICCVEKKKIGFSSSVEISVIGFYPFLGLFKSSCPLNVRQVCYLNKTCYFSQFMSVFCCNYLYFFYRTTHFFRSVCSDGGPIQINVLRVTVRFDQIPPLLGLVTLGHRHLHLYLLYLVLSRRVQLLPV